MNRSILIVICDFLLLSLLTFSTDINHMATDNTQRSAKLEAATNTVVEPGKDLNTMLKQALEDERKGHEQLQQQLAAAQQSVVQQQAVANQRGEENTKLQQQYANAQGTVQNLTTQLQAQVQEATQARQQLTTAQAAVQKETEDAAALRRQLDDLARSNLLAQQQLQLAEAEKQAAADRANLMQQEVAATHAENTKLAEGFQSLATNSSQLTKEIRDNRALAPNTIFSEFVTNRVTGSIMAARTGFLQIDHSKSTQAQMVLIGDGANIYAVCHVDETPISFWDPGTDWDGLTGTLTGHGAPINIHAMAFAAADPRVVMIPVSAAEAQQLGCKVYPISATPYKFQDAVLIGADNGYYGQCSFQIDVNTPQYVKLDRNFIKGLFGKFNPSRGDIVFSQRGELLGIMVNDTYCLMLQDFKTAGALTFGPDVRAQRTGGTLAQMYNEVFQMPLRLQ